MEGYVQSRGAFDLNFEVVALDVNGGHELIEQDAAFGVGGGIFLVAVGRHRPLTRTGTVRRVRVGGVLSPGARVKAEHTCRGATRRGQAA